MIAPHAPYWAMAVVALALPLSACAQGTPAPATSASSPSGTSPSATSTTSAPSPTTTQSLDFTTVQALTAPRFSADPNCAHGVWSVNSTGIREPHRGKATVIQQYDCYTDEDAYLPTRGQQSLFVEFTNDADAAAWATAEQTLYQSLQDGPRVVVTGIGLDAVDMSAYLDDLQKSCGGCGVRRGPA